MKKKITETEKTTTALAFLLIMQILNCDLEIIFPQVSEMAEEGYPTLWQITDLVPVIFTDPSTDLLKKAQQKERGILWSTPPIGMNVTRYSCSVFTAQTSHLVVTHWHTSISFPLREGWLDFLENWASSCQLCTLQTLVMNSVCVVPWIHLSWLN